LVRSYRRRYIAFKLTPAPHASKRDLFVVLTGFVAAQRLVEDAEINHIRVIAYDSASGLCVARWDHRHIGILRSILVGSANAFGVSHVETLRVSGTLKALEKSLATSIRGSA